MVERGGLGACAGAVVDGGEDVVDVHGSGCWYLARRENGAEAEIVVEWVCLARGCDVCVAT